MARFPKSGIYQDGAGNAVASGTVAVTTSAGAAASVYTAETGGTAVNSVTTDSNGAFTFWVDQADYAGTQKFTITLSKTNYLTKSYSNIYILPPAASQIPLDSVSGKFVNDLVDGGFDVFLKVARIGGGATNSIGHLVPNVADDTFALIGASQTLINKTLTAPIIANIKAPSGTTNGHTVPAVADDTIALLAAAQTFSAKTLGSTCVLSNPSGTLDATLTIAGSLITSFGNWPVFGAHNNGVGQSINATTWTKVEFSTEEFDVGSKFAANAFTPAIAGYYQLNFSVYLASLVAGKFMQLAVYKNGVVAKVGAYQYQQTTGDMSVNGSVVVSSDADDYWEIYVYHNDTAARSTSGSAENTYFNGCRIA